jgi:16S rRNA (cytosine967-C5)-methyltransferase
MATQTQGQFVNAALADALNDCHLSERDRAFTTALVLGVIRNCSVLDSRIDKLSDRPAQKISALLRIVLRLALFQLDFMPNIPPQAVLDTATELAKQQGHIGLARFANGLLRNYLRSVEARDQAARSLEVHAADTQASDASDEAGAEKGGSEEAGSEAQEGIENRAAESQAARAAHQYSLPLWMVQRWIENYGREETEKLVAFTAKQPNICVRPCELSITPDGLESLFQRQGISCHRGSLVPSCLIVDRRDKYKQDNRRGAAPADLNGDKKRGFHGALSKLPGYEEGLFSVQDEAAALVSIVLDPKPGERVIDLCAAPGGKTTHIAELMQGHGQVIAVDINEKRLTPLKELRSRLGLTNITVEVQDGRNFHSTVSADRVLVDAPCTGTGVINRRSDLRDKRKVEDIPQLVELQRELLTNAAALIKPGGILVYATCSIEPEENFDNARWFLDNFEDFEPDDIAGYLPVWLLDQCAPTWNGPACKSVLEESRIHTVQLLPSREGISGFFIAKFKRKIQS